MTSIATIIVGILLFNDDYLNIVIILILINMTPLINKNSEGDLNENLPQQFVFHPSKMRSS